jgi:hypothetical protein
MNRPSRHTAADVFLYAANVRQLMSTVSGLPMRELAWEDKLQFEPKSKRRAAAAAAAAT